MEDCLFCKIANHQKESLIWENDDIAAFYDLHPRAPVHVLIVPKRHIERLSMLEDERLAGKLLMAVKDVAKKLDLGPFYRVGIVGKDVPHLHIHLLGKETTDVAPEGPLPEGL